MTTSDGQYAPASVKSGRKDFTNAQLTLAQAVSDSLRSLQARFGAKSLAEFLDGREGQEVAVSTVSRWISCPRRFPSVFLLALAELDPVFARRFLHLLLARLAGATELLAELDPRIAATVAAAQEEMLRRILHGPGGRGESYS